VLNLEWCKVIFETETDKERLNHLSLMSIERELLRKQNFDKLIHGFACKKKYPKHYYSWSV